MAKNEDVFLNRAERQLDNAAVNVRAYAKGHDMEVVILVRKALDAVRAEIWGIPFNTA